MKDDVAGHSLLGLRKIESLVITWESLWERSFKAGENWIAEWEKACGCPTWYIRPLIFSHERFCMVNGRVRTRRLDQPDALLLPLYTKGSWQRDCDIGKYAVRSANITLPVGRHRSSIDGGNRRLQSVAVRWSSPIGAHRTIRNLWTTLTFIFNSSLSPRITSLVCVRQNGSQAITADCAQSSAGS